VGEKLGTVQVRKEQEPEIGSQQRPESLPIKAEGEQLLEWSGAALLSAARGEIQPIFSYTMVCQEPDVRGELTRYGPRSMARCAPTRRQSNAALFIRRCRLGSPDRFLPGSQARDPQRLRLCFARIPAFAEFGKQFLATVGCAYEPAAA
jgi:hypothetical protein